MITKRQKRRLRGRKRRLVSVIYQEIRQLNNIFSTSTNGSLIIIDDPLATQQYDKDKAVKWYNKTFAKRLDDVTTINLEDDISELIK